MSFYTTCPHCEKRIDVEDQLNLTSCHCPECNKEFWMEIKYTATLRGSVDTKEPSAIRMELI